MEKATTSTIVAIVLAFISIFVVMIAGSTAVWLTSEVRVFGLVVLPTAIVAGLLVVYFDWRAQSTHLAASFESYNAAHREAAATSQRQSRSR
jgi:Na+/glutamate symporter